MLRTQLEASWATHSFPFAGELEGALADWLGEGLVRRDGGEPFAFGVLRVSGALDLSRSDFLWMASNTSDAEIQRLCQRLKAVLTHRTPQLIPLASEL